MTILSRFRYYQTRPEIIRLAVMMHVSVFFSCRSTPFQGTARKVPPSRRSGWLQ